MLHELLTKLNPLPQSGERRDRVSILLPFLIIAAGLGVLAWRSYQLSERMQRGASTLAIQYAGYAAEITARRTDAAIHSEIGGASDEWQQIERRSSAPDVVSLQEWINHYNWIVSAIYVPDADPASSIYVSEIQDKAARRPQTSSREFYTSSGTIRYTYESSRLIERVRRSVRQQPLVRTPSDALNDQPQADTAIVKAPRVQGLVRLADGFCFFSKLATPMDAYAVRAIVRTSYIGSGWENQRLISFVLSFVALALTGLGAFLSMRGLNKEAETMKLRGALIANVSHELRTPLAMIRLGAETLRRGGTKLSKDERDQIEESILREVLHLSHLVENVLDVARMQHRHAKALALTPVYPRDLVVSLISTYESWIRSKGFTVALQMDDTIEEQLWDREAVSRAVLNLIDNAIKYSGDDKAIAVVLRQTPELIVVEVTDRGVGIDAREIARIFDPYYRAQFSDTQTRRGAGLGLTLVQQIVASHGGRVEVESSRGTGSTFRLLFPRASASENKSVANLVHIPEPF